MTTSADAPWTPAPDLAWLVALARRLAHPGEDADDLAQETWLVATQQADRSQRTSRAWLAGVLRNLRRMRTRTDGRRRAREQAIVPDEPASPEAALEQVETLEALRAALGELDPVDRRLVLGRYATGCTAVQLGEEFELPASTVRTRLARARERLRKEVECVRGVACFAPWALRPAELGLASAGTGVVAMSTATKIGIGIAAVAVLGIGAHRLAAAPAGTSATVAATTTTDPTTRAPAASGRAEPRTAAQRERARIKRERVRERREARITSGSVADADDAQGVVVSEQCDDGCIGTLTMQIALAQAMSECREDLAPTTTGKTKFRARVLAEPGVGAVIDGVELLEDTVGDAAFTECIIESAQLAELADAEHPIADDFVFRYTVGTPGEPATEFLAAHAELAATRPELAAILAREPGTPLTSEDMTAFARWVDQDPQAQAAFGKWAAEQGIDLAKVRVE